MTPDTDISDISFLLPTQKNPFKLFLTFLTLKSHNSWTSFSSSCARSSFKPIHSRDTRQSWHARETKQARRSFLTCTEMLRNKKRINISVPWYTAHPLWGRWRLPGCGQSPKSGYLNKHMAQAQHCHLSQVSTLNTFKSTSQFTFESLVLLPVGIKHNQFPREQHAVPQLHCFVILSRKPTTALVLKDHTVCEF